MKRVTACVRPHVLEDIKTALSNLSITGLTVTDVRGSGNRAEKSVSLSGFDVLISLPIRSKLEVIVHDDGVAGVIESICAAAHTGEAGDGKIFIESVTDAVRIRTEERGPSAL